MLAQREKRKGTINYEMCKACGGRCCISGPCQYLPSDFDSIEGIEDEIETNYAIIDTGKLKVGGKECLFLRPRTFHEDLNSPELLLSDKNIYMATDLSKRFYHCRFYKRPEKFYLGILYDKWDEEAIRGLTKKQLEKLFALKIEVNRRENKSQTMEENVQDYLASRADVGVGGCLLSESKRPGGALYSIPDYRNGVAYCKGPDDFYTNNWDKPEHQEKLVKILMKKGCFR